MLTRELSTVSHASHQKFQLCFLALLFLFTGSCILIVQFIDEPRRLGAVFAVTGVSIVALIAQMVSLRRQTVTADLIAILARSLEPRQVRGVIEILLARL
ncbi:MAG TPA: hypothetical protein VF491_03440 [Vicinamibacterales bacterium]